MRVAMISGSLTRAAGGIFDIERELSQNLVRLPGIRIQAFAPHSKQYTEDLSRWRPVPVCSVAMFGPARFGYSPRLTAALTRWNPDLVHLHGLWMYQNLAAAKWCERSSRPCMITVHGMLDAWALSWSRGRKRIAGKLFQDRGLRMAACLHANSQSEYRSIRGYGLSNPVCVIPNGVSHPASGKRNPPVWRRSIPQNARVLLYLGRLHPKKGLEPLLHAWKLLHQRPVAAGWILIIAGPGEHGYEKLLASLSRNLRTEASVRIVGAQYGKERDASYAAADAFILPSLSEGMPMSVLEAWAADLPVLMTRACNLPEGFKAGAAVEVRSESKPLAEGLLRFMRFPPSTLRVMGRRGRNLVRTRFSWKNSAA